MSVAGSSDTASCTIKVVPERRGGCRLEGKRRAAEEERAARFGESLRDAGPAGIVSQGPLPRGQLGRGLFRVAWAWVQASWDNAGSELPRNTRVGRRHRDKDRALATRGLRADEGGYNDAAQLQATTIPARFPVLRHLLGDEPGEEPYPAKSLTPPASRRVRISPALSVTCGGSPANLATWTP
jgi:hypothetical protein